MTDLLTEFCYLAGTAGAGGGAEPATDRPDQPGDPNADRILRKGPRTSQIYFFGKSVFWGNLRGLFLRDFSGFWGNLGVVF